MDTITTDNTVEAYFSTLVDLKPDVKIGLIKKLVDSLHTTKPEVKEKKEEKNDSWKRLAGAWNDYGKTAEEIIADIRASRYFDDEDIKL